MNYLKRTFARLCGYKTLYSDLAGNHTFYIKNRADKLEQMEEMRVAFRGLKYVIKTNLRTGNTYKLSTSSLFQNMFWNELTSYTKDTKETKREAKQLFGNHF